MGVKREGDRLRLIDEARVEDAEALLALLQSEPHLEVDWTAAGHLHTAVVQVLLALRPKLVGAPSDIFITRWLLPALSSAEA